MFRHFLTVVLFVTLAACQSQAGLLALNYEGATSKDSALAGSPISQGTSFAIRTVFSDTLSVVLDTGIVAYQPTEINAVVGGMSYTVVDPGNYLIVLVDASNTVFPGLYAPLLLGSNDTFGPGYVTTTPPLDALAPTPTVFSDYIGVLANLITFSTSAGDLTLDFDELVGVNAAINAVPEPSTIFSASAVGLVSLGTLIRRQRNARTA